MSERKTNKYICQQCGAAFEMFGVSRLMLCRKCTKQHNNAMSAAAMAAKRGKCKAKKTRTAANTLTFEEWRELTAYLDRYNKEHGTEYSYGQATLRGII